MSSEWFPKDLQFSNSERRGIVLLVILCLVSGIYCYVAPGIAHRRALARFEALLQSNSGSPEVQAWAADDDAAGKVDTSVSEDLLAGRSTGTRSPAIHKPLKKEALAAERSVRINSASAAEMMRGGLLPPAIAYRVVRFREGAGGFYSIEQLKDVYELTDSMYRAVEDRFVLDTVILGRLSVNTATAGQLMEHPYISKGLAAQIVNFRDKVSPYRTREDLLRLYFMDAALLDKLMPYLTF